MPKCKGKTRSGKKCRAHPLKGTDFCLSHSNAEMRASVGFVPEAGKLGGRPRRPREIELIQEVAEEFKGELRQVYVDGLTATRAVVVGNGPKAYVDHVPDYPMRLKTAAEINDRLHGRPMQATEVSGPEGAPLQIAKMPTDEEWNKSLALLLIESGAYSPAHAMNGNGNGNGSDPH